MAANNSHPGNDYYVSVTGTIQRQGDPILAEGLLASGWSGPYNWTKAKQVANNVAERITAGAVSSSTGGLAGTAGASAQQAVAKTANAATSWEQSVANFFQALGSANLWIRVAKVAIGGGLLIVGVSKLTGADKQVATLGKVVAKAPLL
jgi:hypothetical protein